MRRVEAPPNCSLSHLRLPMRLKSHNCMRRLLLTPVRIMKTYHVENRINFLRDERGKGKVAANLERPTPHPPFHPLDFLNQHTHPIPLINFPRLPIQPLPSPPTPSPTIITTNNRYHFHQHHPNHRNKTP